MRFNFKNRGPKKTNKVKKGVSKNYAPKSNVIPKKTTTPKNIGSTPKRGGGGNKKLPPVVKETIKKENQQFCCAPCYDLVGGKVKPKSCFAAKEKYNSSKYTAPEGTILPRREGRGTYYYKDSKGNEKKCVFGDVPVGCQRKSKTRPTLKPQDSTNPFAGVTVVSKADKPKNPKEIVDKKSEVIFNANKLTAEEIKSKTATASKSAFTPKQTEAVKKKADKAATGGQSPIIFNKNISDGKLPTAGKGYSDKIKTLEEKVDGKLPGLGGDKKGGTFVKASDAAYGGTKAGFEEKKAKSEKKRAKAAIDAAIKKANAKRLAEEREGKPKKEEARQKVYKDYRDKKQKTLGGNKDIQNIDSIGGPGGPLGGSIGMPKLPLPGGPGGQVGGPIGSPKLPLPGGPGGPPGGSIGMPKLPLPGGPGGQVGDPIIRGDIRRDIPPKICSDKRALNYNEACESDTQCCVYEESLREPIKCSDAKTSELRIKLDSIDSEIAVLEQRKNEIINEPEFVPVVEDNTPSGTKYSNLTSNNVSYTTLPGIEKYTKEGVYVRSTVLSIEGNTNQSTQSKGNPDYSDSTKWDAYVNEKLASVYFQLNLANGEKGPIINNLSQGDDADLYREFCLAKGYEYDYFTKVGGKLKYATKSTKGASIYCVDTEFIVVEDVADVKMVFAAKQWDGFLLPESDVNSEVKITMDVMVKFDADVIINKCLAESEIPYIDLNTIYDTTNCDIVVFTDDRKNKEVFRQTKKRAQLIDSETKQVNWVYGDEDEEIWDRSGLQIEPTQEFCKRVGATLFNSDNLYNSNRRKYYDDDIFNYLYKFNEEYADYRVTLKNDIETYSDLVDDLRASGYSVKGFQYPQSNYYDLINTSNVCKLESPIINQAYTTMVQEYGVMIKQLYDLDDELDFCVARYEVLTKEINRLNTEKKNFTSLYEEKKEELAKKQKEYRELQINYKEIKKNNDDLIRGSRNNTDIARYKIKASEDQALFEKQSREYKIGIENLELDLEDIRACRSQLDDQIESIEEQRIKSENCKELRDELVSVLDLLILNNDSITKKTKKLYDNWEKAIEARYRAYLEKTIENVVDYLEGTNIDLSLEVDNSLGTIARDKVYKYTKLWNYSKEDVWRFNKTKSYSGILLEGSEANVNLVKRKVGGSETLFSPLWQRITLTLDNEQCKQLRTCYPDKQFFIGLTINNPKNCQTTLLVDNIQIDTEANYVKKLYSTTLPPSFNLKPVIDDRKSWLYTDGGVITADTKTIFTEPQERDQSGMEYRYTDYTVNHSKLVVNSKETTFRIDPANAVECDVYGFWQEIDCDTCDTDYSCSTATTLTYDNPTGGTVGLVGTVTTTTFDCRSIIAQIKGNNRAWRKAVYEKSNNRDVANSMSATLVFETKDKPYYRQKVSDSKYVNKAANNNGVFKNGGVAEYTPKKLDAGFDIQTNQCNTTIIEIKNDDGTYTLISEELDGDLGFYRYSGDTNQVSDITSFINSECCMRISDIINHEFKYKKPNYKWNGSKCVWNENITVTESCDSDCSYFGTEPIKTDYVSSGERLTATCSDTPVCIKPLDYLEKDPNDVNIKPQFDEMVIANLIDAKSRQVISGYPMLQLFYNQYRDASGCGISLTNRLGVETTFEVMDLIGDYWTDVIEQVVPSTTIWDGIKNSGKLYRNTIFEQTKFPYARYAMNFDEAECDISEITDYHIGVNTGSTIEISGQCLKGNCLGDEMVACNAERKVLLAEKKKLQDKINDLRGILNVIDGVTTKKDELDYKKDELDYELKENDKLMDDVEVIEKPKIVKEEDNGKTAVVETKDEEKPKTAGDREGYVQVKYCNRSGAINKGMPCQKSPLPCCKMKDAATGSGSQARVCTDSGASNFQEPCHSRTNCCVYTTISKPKEDTEERVKMKEEGENPIDPKDKKRVEDINWNSDDIKYAIIDEDALKEDLYEKQEKKVGYEAENEEVEQFDNNLLNSNKGNVHAVAVDGDAIKAASTIAGDEEGLDKYNQPSYGGNVGNIGTIIKSGGNSASNLNSNRMG